MNEAGSRGPEISDPQVATLPLFAELPLLRSDEGGAIRVGNSRILLDLVVLEYENGMTPEEIVRAYDTLTLSEVYGVVAYYLRHRG